jgi:hypothetical protein
MAEESAERPFRPFPALDPEPPRRLTWRSVRWPAIAIVVAGAVAAVVLLTLPSSSPLSGVARARFADGDGLVVFEQQPSGLLGTAAPDGSHRVMLARVGALQGTDLPVASSDGRYLVNLEGQLVTMGPAGPASIGSVADAATQGPAGGWSRATFADGSKDVVVTECDATSTFGEVLDARLIPTGGGKPTALGTNADSAGDPASAGAIVSALAGGSSASSSNQCSGSQPTPDKAIELLRPGQAPRTVVTAAMLNSALGWPGKTTDLLFTYPSPDGRLLALDVAAQGPQPATGPPAQEDIVVLTRAGEIVAHMPMPAGTSCVQWSPTGQQIAFGQAGQEVPSSVTVWAAGKGKAVRTIVLPGRHDLYCRQLLWSPDGSQLIYSAQVTGTGLTQADDVQHGWTVIDLRSGQVQSVTAPGQPTAWLPTTTTTTTGK